MDVRVEPSLGLDLRKTFLGQQIVERAVHEPDSVLELRLLVIRGGLERTPEIVEDRDQLLDEPFVGALGKRRLLARIALAEVVELRGEPLEPIEKRIAFSLESLDVQRSSGVSAESGTSRFPRTPSTGPLSRTGGCAGACRLRSVAQGFAASLRR